MLIEKVETLKVLDGEMAELVPEEELEEEIQRADQYKERVYGVLAKLNKALGPITAPLPTVVARTETSPTVRRPLPVAETSPPVTEPRTGEFFFWTRFHNLVVFKGENCACANGIAKQRYIRSNSFSTEDYLSSTK